MDIQYSVICIALPPWTTVLCNTWAQGRYHGHLAGHTTTSRGDAYGIVYLEDTSLIGVYVTEQTLAFLVQSFDTISISTTLYL